VLDNGGAGTTYSTTARTKYANYADKTPDVNAPLLPLLEVISRFASMGKKLRTHVTAVSRN
jgi:hypothetical protein